MNLTPMQAFEQTKEALAQYIETQYRIANPLIQSERSVLLRSPGMLARNPFIESTPSFAPGELLKDLQLQRPELLSPLLAGLVEHGIPVGRFPLYVHQQQALLASRGDRPNLLVATGTGSGKTEAFLLPILNDILLEAQNWTPPSSPAEPGHFDVQNKRWLSSRRHETRPAAVRGMVLYPMNALVNDQLTRLRRVLSRSTSQTWQEERLAGNSIQYGMYTSLAQKSGPSGKSGNRKTLQAYLEEMHKQWEGMPERLRDTGNWPRPSGNEMLTRWDMQASPPDLVVTNYSMLEYMMMRPLEANIFDATRHWLSTAPGARFTLVLDEAHTYTGAGGTEVAHLIKRLKVRLGLSSGDPRFRAIATTASVPEGKDDELLEFVSGLFGEPATRFHLIGTTQRAHRPDKRDTVPQAMAAFARFGDAFDVRNPLPAIETLAQDLGRTLVPSEHAEVQLHSIIEPDPHVEWARERTARRATPLETLSTELWEGQGTEEEQQRALAGVLAAGSFARQDDKNDTPPVLSVRMHAFFRGFDGLWACMDPECPHAPPAPAGEHRPVGKLYAAPRSRCECGARVLQVFTCRTCGLMHLGGIKDGTTSPEGADGLWPMGDKFDSQADGDESDYIIFGVEAPNPHQARSWRSTRTTWPAREGEAFIRPVYEVEVTRNAAEEITSHLPASCPRCLKGRTPSPRLREVIEPLNTKGVQAFAAIMEEGFRNQPRSSDRAPNYGRKAMAFSDSRRNASRLAQNLKDNHSRNVVRQVLYRALHLCNGCRGAGSTTRIGVSFDDSVPETITVPCAECHGSGRQASAQPMRYKTLHEVTTHEMVRRGIDPTGQAVADVFAKARANNQAIFETLGDYVDVLIRGDISAMDFGMGPLGLGVWRVEFERPAQPAQGLKGMTPDETDELLHSLVDILATNNVIAAPAVRGPRETHDWGEASHRMRAFNICTVNPTPRSRWNSSKAPRKYGPSYGFSNDSPRYSRIGRQLAAVSLRLVELGRITPTEEVSWLNTARKKLFDALVGYGVLSPAQPALPEPGADKNQDEYAVRLDRFWLHPAPATVHRCRSCRDVRSFSPLGVCSRCGQQTEVVPTSELSNYFRTQALNADPANGGDDPFPLKASEHTAQVDPAEIRKEERWFQDMFQDDQDDLDHRVDVLSVTTTMEMGIDIGSLLNVGMRNMPPTISNYQQRAGRAGRRGSALATVFTFAENRSHGQYYYRNPPKMISQPPRVPTLYLGNEIIARRHLRTMVLQDYFLEHVPGQSASLFDAWGTVKEFRDGKRGQGLRNHLIQHRERLLTMSRAVMAEELHKELDTWISEVPREVVDIVQASSDADQVHKIIMSANKLPKYAFPIDVASLTVANQQEQTLGEKQGDLMTRDKQVALSEYAPGADITRQQSQRTMILRSVGVHDPGAFFKQGEQPYAPQGFLSECANCKDITPHALDQEMPIFCQTCNSPELERLDYYQPNGYTTDVKAHPRIYETGTNAERSGQASHARLNTGKNALDSGVAVPETGARLFSHVHVGKLMMYNRGEGRKATGFFICPTCGRMLTSKGEAHTYPTSVPPYYGRHDQIGPRGGTRCPHEDGTLPPQVVLMHSFQSEVISLGLTFPPELQTRFWVQSGQACWHSLSNLIATAASVVLQVDRSELQTGVRPLLRGEQLSGEAFIYDNVPGGAGYARAIETYLPQILLDAESLGEKCSNADCQGACYQCLLNYRNQSFHHLLDRHLGTAMLRYALHGEVPQVGPAAGQQLMNDIESNLDHAWKRLPGVTAHGTEYAAVLEPRHGQGSEPVALQVLHPMQAPPGSAERNALLNTHGLRVAAFDSFDLARRPYTVLTQLQDGQG